MFYPYLYFEDDLKEVSKIKKRIMKKDKKLKAYVIIFSENPSDQLEIRNVQDLFGKAFVNRKPMIIGIGNDYDDCVNIVTKIAKECFLKNHDGNLKNYLRERVL